MKKFYVLMLLACSTWVRGEETNFMKIVNGSPFAATNPVWSLHPSVIHSKHYQVQGCVKYDQVQGDGYLEMWSTFADGKSYFTRTLDENGPLAKITGQSEWREFQLPFECIDSSNTPVALAVNVVLNGSGTVYVTLPKLVELPMSVAETNPRIWFFGNTQHPWWTANSVAWLNLPMTVFVCLLDMTLMLFALRGIGTNVCVIAFKLQAVLGLGLCGVAWVAFHQEQPFVVWYPPLLWGGLLLFLSPGFAWAIRKSTRAQELRRMQALDA